MGARRILLAVLIGLVGIALAAGVGLASSLIGRDTVGLPATNLKPARPLAPAAARTGRPAGTAKPRTPTTTTTTAPTPTVTDDHGGRSGHGSSGSGRGSSGSGRSGSDD